MLTVEKVVIIGFIHGGKNTAADFGKHAQFEIGVFKIDGDVLFVFLLIGQDIGYRIRINPSLGTLVPPAGIETRIRIGLVHGISRYLQWFGPYLNARLRMQCNRKDCDQKHGYTQTGNCHIFHISYSLEDITIGIDLFR